MHNPKLSNIRMVLLPTVYSHSELRDEMGIVVWWYVSRSVPFVVIQSSCQQINASVHKVKQYKDKDEKLLLCNMYVHMAWSSAVNLSTCRVIVFPMGTEYICDPMGTGVPMQGLLLPTSLAFIFVITS